MTPQDTQKAGLDDNEKQQVLKAATDFVVQRLNDKQTDISRFTKEANEHEFFVSKQLMGWGILSLGGMLSQILISDAGKVPYLYSAYFRVAAPIMALSIAFGILHHLLFSKMLRNESSKLEIQTRSIARRLNEEGELAAARITLELRKERDEEPGIKSTKVNFLFWQAAMFGLAVIVAVLPVYGIRVSG